MKYRNIGDLKVSSIGLGCMGISVNYGMPSATRDVKNIISKSIDLGYTLFDTAECYGFKEEPHHNEIVLGQALKPYRNKIIIATKFGMQVDYNSATVPISSFNSSPETIRKSIEGSLKRLQTDYIDLYFQHRFDPNIPIEDVAEVMQELKNEGKILHWGLSETNEETIRKAHKICPITAIENIYNMIKRSHEVLFPTLEELNIGFISFMPMASGFLSNKYDTNSKFKENDFRVFMPQFKKESFDKCKELFELLSAYAQEKNVTPAQISLAWMLNKKDYIVPIPGTRKLNRLEENAMASEIELSKEEINEIDNLLNNPGINEIFRNFKI